jgi:hypothetical protein
MITLSQSFVSFVFIKYVVAFRVARGYIFIPTIQSGCILEGLGQENVGILYGH